MKEQVRVNMCGFEDVSRRNYSWNNRDEVEARPKQLKKAKANF